MNTSICTLFEGHYHYGVVALCNSLYKQGFLGDIYIGYRGELPNWALNGNKQSLGKWDDVVVFTIFDGLKIFFIKIKTAHNLANYKPNFMLELWKETVKDKDALYYFDTDIVLNEKWTCFEDWVNIGVALCEDVNSPLQSNHPRRVGWRNYYNKHKINLNFKNEIYVNAGFVGVSKHDIHFLEIWSLLQEKMSNAIGGLENSIFSNQQHISTVLKMNGFQIFDKPDQDALNAAIEVYDGIISFIGKEGMGFSNGHVMMFHALGPNKPWKVNYLKNSFYAKTPGSVDIAYWDNTLGPIIVHSKFKIYVKKYCIKLAKFIGRFYSK